MKKIVLAICIIGLAVGGFQLVNQKEEKIKEQIERVDENNPPLEVQKQMEENKDYLAKNFVLRNIEGKEITLESLRGKNIMLNFWASWCSPCREEMPSLQKLYEESKSDKDFEIITINSGENEKEVKKFIKENKYDFNVLLDHEGEVTMDYRVFAMPTTYFIDKDGYVKKEVKGTMSYDIMKQYKENLINNTF